MKKIIMMISLVLLFCGCSVDYNITFTSDHKINENIIITVSKKELEDDEYSASEIIDSKFASYSNELMRNGFSKKVDINDEKATISLTSKNKRVSKFTKFMYFGSMFNGADVVENEETYSFKTNGYYNQSGLFYDESGIVDEGFVDQININIQFEDEVISSNADKVDNEKNIYTWVLNKDTKEKSIEFVLNNKNHDSKREKKQYKKPDKKRFSLKSVIIIFVSIIASIILVGYYLYKKNQE